MLCYACQTDNLATANHCQSCATSLRPARAAFHLDLAEQAILNGRYQQAELLLAQAELADKPASLLRAEILNRLGVVCSYQGQMTEAEAYYQESAANALAATAPTVATRALINLGTVLASDGRADAAASYYAQALAQARLSTDQGSQARVCRALAGLYASYGPYNLAVDYARQALALREEVEELQSYVILVCAASRVLVVWGELSEAEGYLNEAYKRAQQSGNQRLEEQVLVELASLMEKAGQHDAWQRYVEQLILVDKSGSASGVAVKTSLLSYALAEQDWGQARRLVAELKTLAAANPSTREAATQAKARLHNALGEW